MKYNFSKLISSLILIAILPVSLLVGSADAANITFNTKKDCNSNAVIDCGVMSTTAVQHAYNSDASVRIIYNYFGITTADISNLKDTNVAGYVTKSGDVYVGGIKVAGDAWTAGRDYIAGGSYKETVSGVTFYKRKPAVSFLSSSLDAYVSLNSKGQFQFAILASCGNPIKATNFVVIKKTPIPKPTPKPKPTPTPTPTPSPTTTPSALVNTGPGSYLAPILGLSTASGIGFNIYNRRKALR